MEPNPTPIPSPPLFIPSDNRTRKNRSTATDTFNSLLAESQGYPTRRNKKKADAQDRAERHKRRLREEYEMQSRTWRDVGGDVDDSVNKLVTSPTSAFTKPVKSVRYYQATDPYSRGGRRPRSRKRRRTRKRRRNARRRKSTRYRT